MDGALRDRIARWRKLAEPPERQPMGHHLGLPTPQKARLEWERDRQALAGALLEACTLVETIEAERAELERKKEEREMDDLEAWERMDR